MSEEIEQTDEIQVKRGRKSREDVVKASKDAGLFSVKLKRNYRPMGEFLVEEGGEVRDPGFADDGSVERDKMFAGAVIHLPRDEAKRAVSLGIADINDPFG
jgi:hypothetical protein